MRTRTALSTTLVAALLAAAASPSLAATKPKPKPKPKPIHGSYTATAYPDPTSTNPVTSEPCVPTLPTAKFSKPFKVPAAGILHVELANQLDWSLAVRDTDGSDEATSDGGSPTDKELVDIPFKRATSVVIDTCNFAGEPNVVVSYTFTYK
jgi:hypothetical protein